MQHTASHMMIDLQQVQFNGISRINDFDVRLIYIDLDQRPACVLYSTVAPKKLHLRTCAHIQFGNVCWYDPSIQVAVRVYIWLASKNDRWTCTILVLRDNLPKSIQLPHVLTNFLQRVSEFKSTVRFIISSQSTSGLTHSWRSTIF